MNSPHLPSSRSDRSYRKPLREPHHVNKLGFRVLPLRRFLCMEVEGVDRKTIENMPVVLIELSYMLQMLSIENPNIEALAEEIIKGRDVSVDSQHDLGDESIRGLVFDTDTVAKGISGGEKQVYVLVGVRVHIHPPKPLVEPYNSF